MNFNLVLVIMTGIISYQAFNNPAMKQKLLFYPYSTHKNGEWYRFLTSGFVHADWTHLLVNLFVLYQFGKIVEYYFENLIFGQGLGKIVFILFYLSAIVVSSIPTYFQHQENAYYRALGASGATSAVVFVFILFHPWEWFIFPPLPAILFGIGYLWYSSYMDKQGRDNIGHNAHLWGAVYGLVFVISIALLYKPELLNLFIDQLLVGPGMPNF